jgi:hypothetical protein
MAHVHSVHPLQLLVKKPCREGGDGLNRGNRRGCSRGVHQGPQQGDGLHTHTHPPCPSLHRTPKFQLWDLLTMRTYSAFVVALELERPQLLCFLTTSTSTLNLHSAFRVASVTIDAPLLSRSSPLPAPLQHRFLKLSTSTVRPETPICSPLKSPYCSQGSCICTQTPSLLLQFFSPPYSAPLNMVSLTSTSLIRDLKLYLFSKFYFVLWSRIPELDAPEQPCSSLYLSLQYGFNFTLNSGELKVPIL